MPHVPVVVIGAGHCGLATSHCLTGRSIDHVVLERGEVGHSWRTQRWDSLRLLTPNWLVRLPGFSYSGAEPDGYMSAREVASLIEGYATGAPLRTHTGVTSLRRGFRIGTDHGEWTADAVVIASGACNVAKVPEIAAALPDDIVSLTPADYRRPGQVPDGGVLVVGASASGIQIADELVRAGRQVRIAVGEHVRMPRRYRGADILWWMEQAGVLDESWDGVDDLVRARRTPSMQLAGIPETLDLNALATRGATLHGKLAAIRGGRMLFSGGLRNVCALADLKLNRTLDALDAWALDAGAGAGAPPERFAPTEVPGSPQLELDLRGAEIGTVVWATGFRPDLSWVELPVRNARGRLVHDGGATQVPGLFFMGMPFMRRRKSTLIDGARADAPDIVAMVAAHLDARARATA